MKVRMLENLTLKFEKKKVIPYGPIIYPGRHCHQKGSKVGYFRDLTLGKIWNFVVSFSSDLEADEEGESMWIHPVNHSAQS